MFLVFPKKLQDENHSRLPTTIYAASKIAGEVICERYARSYGMDISIVRLFSVYGPYSSPHLVTNKIINQTINNKKLKINIDQLNPVQNNDQKTKKNKLPKLKSISV